MGKIKLEIMALLGLAMLNSCIPNYEKPVADFSFTGGGYAPCQVVFENKSQEATSYEWDFGDGTRSTETNPTKTYDLGGTFSVSLKASGEGGSNSITKQIIIDNPQPEVEISLASLTISLPVNCPSTFQITNIGPQGSMLDYVVADDGALQGFLDIQNAIGSLSAGSSVTVSITVKPEFTTTGFGTMAGTTFILHVNTPEATNSSVIPVSVNITSVLGTWSGTWSGISNSSGVPSNGPEPTSPVNGTWILDLQSTNSVDSSASGTLTWNGFDKYWVYTYDNLGNLIVTPHTFIPDRTIQFNRSNTTIIQSYGACDVILLTIEGFPNNHTSSDEFYGPWFNIALNTKTNTATMLGNNGFLAHPYDASNNVTVCSYGNLYGAKQ